MEKKPDIIQSFIKLGCKCSNNGYHLYDIQKWLRDNKDIHIILNIDLLSRNYNYIVFSKLEAIKEYKLSTYEEALEAGIWESYFILNN